MLGGWVRELLGVEPTPDTFTRDGMISCKWLAQNFDPGTLPANAPDDRVKCVTRACILRILASQYLQDMQGTGTQLYYLPFMRDLEQCGQYSWGSAILAFLYRSLCKAASGKVDGVNGALILLQFWAWSRFRPIQPNKLFPAEELPRQQWARYPYGHRWSTCASKYDKGGICHSLRMYRDLFDQLSEDQVIWEPYKNEIIHLPDSCKAGQAICRARVPLICLEIVEWPGIMGTEQNRFLLHQEMAPQQRRKRWGGCLGGLPCFGAQKKGKRVVPASRIPEGNSSSNAQNGPQNGVLANHATSIVPSLLAPPSSPASFSNSAIPSTVQSPNCFLSSNSPERPTAFATGPYAHETQLVSPPVFSTFTTEPSTAPFTPPPELAHLTTPSSPDVPFAQFLSSSTNLKGIIKNNFNDFRASYSPYTVSPANSDPGRIMGIEAASAYKSQDSNFFCPATFAQFYLDNPPNAGGRLSVSKESDVCSNVYQNRQNIRSCKQDGDEIEAYRASFGFSADEIITTQHYVEIKDVMDESLAISSTSNGQKREETFVNSRGHEESSFVLGDAHGAVDNDVLGSGDNLEGLKSWRQLPNISVKSPPVNHIRSKNENIFSWKGSSRSNRKYYQGLSSSDAEIDYRRGRSLRERKANSEWRD